MNINKKTASWGAKAVFKTTLNKSDCKPFSAKNQRGKPHNYLPSPFYYYQKMFPSIISESEWVSVRCCFHNDRNPSLSINLKSGGFFCHACGAKGGDVIAFHRQRYSLGYKKAVFQLKKIRWEELK